MDEDSRKRMLADETRFEMSRMMDAIRDSLKYFWPKAVSVIANLDELFARGASPENGGASS